MRRNTAIYMIIAIFALLTFTNEGNCFAGANDVKARMQQRLPTIVKMKAEGIVGENNGGYLEYVSGATQKMPDVVADENNDRQTVYSAIAKQQNTTPQMVGERRAMQIRQNASPGEWLQDSSGKWYKK